MVGGVAFIFGGVVLPRTKGNSNSYLGTWRSKKPHGGSKLRLWNIPVLHVPICTNL